MLCSLGPKLVRQFPRRSIPSFLRIPDPQILFQTLTPAQPGYVGSRVLALIGIVALEGAFLSVDRCTD